MKPPENFGRKFEEKSGKSRAISRRLPTRRVIASVFAVVVVVGSSSPTGAAQP